MNISRKGFTLVEIMIVVAIIALLAAIAIPNLLRAKVAANESSAMATLRTVSTASETFATANTGNYPTQLDTSLQNATPPYINKTLCGAALSGYTIDCTGNTGGYTLTASPIGNAGVRTFTMMTGGVLTGPGT